MKKHLSLAAGIAVTLFMASCDNNSTGNDTVAENELSTEAATQPIDNPNVATTEEVVAPENAPAISFEEQQYDFGTIKQGEMVDHTFSFTNTGKSPLVIENASASCGCTVPEWPREPIAPGAKGAIQVKFNSTGKMGQQMPTVTIRANTVPNLTKVSMQGTVESGGVPEAPANGPVKQ